jgi:hypothetical protein
LSCFWKNCFEGAGWEEGGGGLGRGGAMARHVCVHRIYMHAQAPARVYRIHHCK